MIEMGRVCSSDAACKRESRNREQSEKSLSCSSAAAEWVNRKSFKIKRFSEWFAAYLFFCVFYIPCSPSRRTLYIYIVPKTVNSLPRQADKLFFFIHEKPVIQWNNMLLMNEQERKIYIYKFCNLPLFWKVFKLCRAQQWQTTMMRR